MQSATPEKFLSPVWPLSISLATTLEISVDFFSSPYLDVSVQAVPLIYLFIQYMIRTLLMRGLLHSDTLGSIRACRSPRLFAAYRVLHRLLMPRHPPCALISLNSLFAELCLVLFFRILFLGEVEIVFTQLLYWIFYNFLFVVSLFNFQRSLFTLRHLKSLGVICWWAEMDSNHRPLGYQPSALTS